MARKNRFVPSGSKNNSFNKPLNSLSRNQRRRWNKRNKRKNLNPDNDENQINNTKPEVIINVPPLGNISNLSNSSNSKTPIRQVSPEPKTYIPPPIPDLKEFYESRKRSITSVSPVLSKLNTPFVKPLSNSSKTSSDRYSSSDSQSEYSDSESEVSEVLDSPSEESEDSSHQTSDISDTKLSDTKKRKIQSIEPESPKKLVNQLDSNDSEDDSEDFSSGFGDTDLKAQGDDGNILSSVSQSPNEDNSFSPHKSNLNGKSKESSGFKEPATNFENVDHQNNPDDKCSVIDIVDLEDQQEDWEDAHIRITKSNYTIDIIKSPSTKTLSFGFRKR